MGPLVRYLLIRDERAWLHVRVAVRLLAVVVMAGVDARWCIVPQASEQGQSVE